MSATKWAFALRGDGTEALEIDIYDVIGESWWREDAVSAKSVRSKLKANPDATLIKLRVNSRGGDVIDGFAIYNLLNEHPARVEADVDALAASMASVVIMAADEIRIASNGFVMIHNPWAISLGEAEDLRATADLLDKMMEQIAEVYVARTGMDRARVLEMMASETWLSPQEAKQHGFVDKVRSAKRVPAPKKETARALAGLDLSDLLHVPKGLLAAVAQARTEVRNSAVRRVPMQIALTGEDYDDPQESDMGDEQKNLLAALGVASVAEAAARLALLSRLEALAGKTGDEAFGVFAATSESHKRLPTLQAELNELKKENGAAKLEALITQGKADKKLTPALEKSLRDQVAAGDLSVKGAEAMIATLAPIAALGVAHREKPRDPATTGAAPAAAGTWNGRTYAELTNPERAQLSKEQPDLYAEMRKTYHPSQRRTESQQGAGK
jgi:ATP-dependent protease ClpP protease subunit